VSKRFVVASNRLPVRIEHQLEGWCLRPGSGGLVTALVPVMSRTRGLWIGWPGCGPDVPIDTLLQEFSAQHSYDLRAIPLTEAEEQGYYRGFANEALWPLFHDLLGYCRFELADWAMYERVNEQFAAVIASEARAGDFIWIHDYQLLRAGHYLRRLRSDAAIALFLHTPFPSPDLLRRLPWSDDILEGMLAHNVLGFQTLRDRRNFVACVREFVPDTEIEVGRRYTRLGLRNRIVHVGHFPISIDFDEFDSGARSPEVARAASQLREGYLARQLILGLDRLDYTKGIPERFLAFERALEKYPDLLGNVSLIQVVVPSRTHVPDYRDLKSEIDGLAGRVNGRFSRDGWVPIHYYYRALSRTDLLAHYRACEIAFITPLRDGMNLVAKEYCASTVDGNGVLILSEFAGAADQLCVGALCVNPFDRERSADALHTAFTMEPSERRRRMQLLRAEVRRNDVHRWLGWITAIGTGPQSGRSMEESESP